MTEGEARDRCASYVSHETIDLLGRYIDLLAEASASQNLISAGSMTTVWRRHILDSLQLAPHIAGRCADVGSGAGLPGVVLAIAGGSVLMIEPRRKRADFLAHVVETLAIRTAAIVQRSAAQVSGSFSTITARALAPMDRLLATTGHLAGPSTRWVLPKGANAQSELEVARRTWHGRFETLPSITDPSGSIVIAEHVSQKPR